MPLNPGARLGPYEIAGIIGAGGMGEVYRATDTVLNRVVALKVLPDAFAADAERVAPTGRAVTRSRARALLLAPPRV